MSELLQIFMPFFTLAFVLFLLIFFSAIVYMLIIVLPLFVLSIIYISIEILSKFIKFNKNKHLKKIEDLMDGWYEITSKLLGIKI